MSTTLFDLGAGIEESLMMSGEVVCRTVSESEYRLCDVIDRVMPPVID